MSVERTMPYSCVYCLTTFGHPNAVKSHMSSGSCTRYCSGCVASVPFESQCEALSHYTEYHRDSVYVCSDMQCSEAFLCSRNLESHMKIAHGRTRASGSSSNHYNVQQNLRNQSQSFNNSEATNQNHVFNINVNNNIRMNPKQSRKRGMGPKGSPARSEGQGSASRPGTRGKDNVKKHKKSDKKKKPTNFFSSKCRLCTQAFNSFASMVLHSMKDHRTSHLCEFCGYVDFKNPVSSGHIGTHSAFMEKLRFGCMFCQEHQTKRADAKSHVSQAHPKESEELRCKTPRCFAVFPSKECLEVHQEIFHPELVQKPADVKPEGESGAKPDRDRKKKKKARKDGESPPAKSACVTLDSSSDSDSDDDSENDDEPVAKVQLEDRPKRKRSTKSSRKASAADSALHGDMDVKIEVESAITAEVVSAQTENSSSEAVAETQPFEVSEQSFPPVVQSESVKLEKQPVADTSISNGQQFMSEQGLPSAEGSNMDIAGSAASQTDEGQQASATSAANPRPLQVVLDRLPAGWRAEGPGGGGYGAAIQHPTAPFVPDIPLPPAGHMYPSVVQPHGVQAACLPYSGFFGPHLPNPQQPLNPIRPLFATSPFAAAATGAQVPWNRPGTGALRVPFSGYSPGQPSRSPLLAAPPPPPLPPFDHGPVYDPSGSEHFASSPVPTPPAPPAYADGGSTSTNEQLPQRMPLLFDTSDFERPDPIKRRSVPAENIDNAGVSVKPTNLDGESSRKKKKPVSKRPKPKVMVPKMVQTTQCVCLECRNMERRIVELRQTMKQVKSHTMSSLRIIATLDSSS